MSMPSTGLQALILCGPGSSFPTFTSNPDESPKALLPIANRPMVWYPIDFCHRMGITDITLICPPSASNAMNSAFSINPSLTSLPLPKPDIVSPKDLDFNTGTAKILCLAEVRDLVKLDFVVLPCDLVCELGGDKLLQAWMIKAASLAHLVGHGGFADGHGTRHSGGLGVWYNTKTAVPVKGEETDFIATAPLPPSQPDALKGPVLSNLSRLVYSMPTDSLNDLMEEKKSLPIRHGLLRAHPRLRMYTAHRDAHIYIFPRWIMDFINVNQRLDSIGEDVVGWWAKAGWQAGLADKLHITSLCSTRNPDDDQDSIPDSVSSHASCAEHSAAGPSDEAPAGPEPFGQGDGRRQNDSGHSWHATDVPPILAYLHSSEGQANAPILRRVDNAQLLLATSLQLAKLESVEEVGAEAASPFAHARKVAYPEGVKPRTTITKPDSLIAENVTVEEKTAIKESVVGANCQIKEGAKLSQCLLMDGVVVGKGCKLTKCILGRRCVIGDYSVLTDCEVQENLLVEPRTEDKDQKLMSSEGLEATEAEMDRVLQDVDREVTAMTDEAAEK
ncbi:uncharacterized protein UV8b_05611 [Ustilaginoidea virens]|uniref:Translation initiation factor eIF2B subunit gamma n=1 Tax=Ustilaginoidea virens TaxID=1159556 RepID=A0A063BLB8_USTVR|nr:uncharacterized protein UV8b_05611 [Ustilaginoidea virens]QUC21368.1 hypothetical protein UV8b_05611 [Ustilaginoidea virens]GAO16179.1 hypothetical protein UVI_02045260 [Ustilaginoidea virens]